jgi:hypothetical protein
LFCETETMHVGLLLVIIELKIFARTSTRAIERYFFVSNFT